MIKDLFLLFKRAALWRCSLILTCLLGLYILFFPPAKLKEIAPWLPETSFNSTHSPHNMEATQDASTQALTARSQQNTHEPDHILSYPNMDTTFHHYASLAHHQIPLPAGDWHPILEAVTKDAFPIHYISLIRVENHNITGLIFAEATHQNEPLSLAQTMITPCHDDRNLIIERYETAQSAQCILLQPALLTGLDADSDDFVNDTIARLRLSSLVLPPFMIAASWRYMQLDAQNMSDMITIDTLLPPVEPHQHHMLAPFEAWHSSAIEHFPKAKRFLYAYKSWLHLWHLTLEETYHHHPSTPPKNDRDPLAP